MKGGIKMSNEIITTDLDSRLEPFQLHNRQLITKSKQIIMCENSTKKSLLKTARLFAEVQEKGLYKDDFSNIAEYGAKVFGYKQAYVYQLVTVGSLCINEKFESVLDDKEHHYTVGQLTEIVPLIKSGMSKEAINQFIAPTLSAKEIRGAVKEKLEYDKKSLPTNVQNAHKKKEKPLDEKIQKEVNIFIKKIAELIGDINDFQYTGELKENTALYSIESIDEPINCAVNISFKTGVNKL